MRVQFTYTQEDLVDASMRFLARSKMIRSWRATELRWTVLLTWIIVFLIFRSSTIKAVIAATVATLISVWLVALFQPAIIRRRLRKYVKEQHGDENEFPCEVDLSPAGVRVKERTIQGLIDWQKVEEIAATADSVDIFARPGGVIVRDRAFRAMDEKNRFVEIAQSYLTAAREGTK